MRGLIAATAIIIATSAGSVWAEKVKTNQSAKLYSRPGEQAKVVVTVKPGQNMTVLAKEGRWLKVRFAGRTGFVPRSKVDMADDDEIVRNTRRRPFVDGRGTKRGFGSEQGPDDRIGADATDAEEKSEPEPKAKPHKEPAKPAKAKPAEDEDDEEDKPKAHKEPAKPAAKPAPKAKPADDEEEDEDKPKAKPAAKPAPKAKPADDEEEDEDKPKARKGGDDDKTEEDDAKADERPVAHVSAKTKVYSERSKDSEAAFVAKPKDILYPTESKGKWTMVETDEGDAGWVLTSQLDVNDSGDSGPKRKREFDLGARLGVTFLAQGMRAVGSTIMMAPPIINPDNYNIGTSAATIALGARVVVPRGKKYLIGGEVAFDYSKTLLGGIHIPAPNVDTAVSLTNINARLLAGIDLHRKSGMAVFGRLGYRYQGFIVDDYADMTKNPAQIPSEVLQAPTLGIGINLPKLTDKIGFDLSLDAILIGASISQTEGLEDGNDPSAKVVCLGSKFVYRWKKSMDIQGTYDLNYASYDFGGLAPLSRRGHTGTDTTRTDLVHMVTVGVMKAF